ncbi:rRNA pseudouridine synthase [Flavobacterium sp. MAH-1]|uniref:rRNA pseudouridine synthase n=1 Tax=Flavobacterium agri TaxID=2743471 RepID=A0A7Y8Y162_9FLAO|nr:pseudouridine synthase [Flavobacterium agri]NUY80680.1 rRNA pseudouridine synthase [Flavobacterium agri]NYA70704.1 rRNA pseudouridine synthase [Flavobacterium agri]
MDKPNNDKRFDRSKGKDGRTNFFKPKSDAKPALPKRTQKPKKEAAPAKAAKASDEIRLNKYIANSGACSRRDADIYIQSGNVKVNGAVVTEMGYKVKPGDVVNFDGSLITPERKEYVLLNKPKNFSTSGDEEKGSNNVLDLVRSSGVPNLKPVGRMDKTTTGLLLFTNDNDMVVKFGKPNQKSPKIYQVSLDRNLKFEDLEKISGGVTLDEHRLFVDEISYVEGEPKTEIGLKLRTANVKVVRAIFEQFKYNVLKIDRVSFAGLTKKNLPRGNWRFLTEQEVINLRNG